VAVISWWVPGRPATFATAGERPWKDAVREHVAVCLQAHSSSTLDLSFVVDGAPSGSAAADLDNLLEPLMSALVNGQGWFGGRRPNVINLRATKQYAQPTGCQISIIEQPPEAAVALPVFDGVFDGPLPVSATDPVVSDWLLGANATVIEAGPVAVDLRFGGPVNLGDIATGKVKTTIDGLWPLLGGSAGRPDDSRITALTLSRTVPGIPATGVHVRVGRP
jgi:hypothetical protein